VTREASIRTPAAEQVQRRLPVGAEIQGGGVHFRCWAPGRRRVRVVVERRRELEKVIDLAPERDGYFSGFAGDVGAGTRYGYELDGGSRRYPDPASRFQPDGPHGASEVIDPFSYEWRHAQWGGVTLKGQVLYEMHVGTFTREGTWESAAAQFGELSRLGVSVLEVMPVAEFPGRFGWGYDGVDLFAPTHLYGRPDDFRRFVDEAHGHGLAVILDVVYNHLGPDASYLKQFAGSYFTDRYANEWGDAINFDGEDSAAVREFFVHNAGYWVDEYRLDGLRLDATQTIFDRSREHVLLAINRRVREAARGRRTIIVAENEPQHVRLVRPPEDGGYGLDALWNDDFHHSAMVAMTGRKEAYYTDYNGTPQEFVSTAKRGYLYQGQSFAWQRKSRGTPTRGISPAALVNYLQNHDQVANSGRGERIDRLTSPGRLRAVTTLLLLQPQTPLLFQGQEFAASSPFLYFADHRPDLAAQVRHGRASFLGQFPSLGTAEMQACLPDPGSRETFDRCKLDFAERETHGGAYRLHRDLLALRRTDPVFRAQSGELDGAVLGSEAFALRFFAEAPAIGDRLLLVNLGRDLHLDVVPEPLLAPPENMSWSLLWSSEAPPYGGCGTPPVETEAGWRLPGHAAVVLAAAEPGGVQGTPTLKP
jgi:maltooligosyltrehalose trehalohydrolase